MTTNEKIARWLGKDIHIGPTRDLCDGDLYRFGDAEGICIVHVTDDESHSFVGWNPEEYIEDWHGADGLLAEIERRGKWLRFIKTFAEVCGDAGIEASLGNALVTPLSPEDVWSTIWTMLRATPAQLAAALVAVIKEE